MTEPWRLHGYPSPCWLLLETPQLLLPPCPCTQLLLAPFQVPQAPTGLLGHPLLHFHCPVCSCSGLRGDSWAVVKGRDGKRGEEAQAHPWLREWARFAAGMGAWPLLFSLPAALVLPRAQMLPVPNHKPHPAAITAGGDNESSFQYLKAFAVMRISPHTTPKPTCKAEFPRGKNLCSTCLPLHTSPLGSLQLPLSHLKSHLLIFPPSWAEHPKKLKLPQHP